jgi:mannose-6-phosphate isomerase-like protein (cupin superfamily)
MKIIRKPEAEIIQNGPITAHEYDFGDPVIDVARIEIIGRYPVEGRVMNEKVRELAYIAEGSGTIYVEEEAYPFFAGDALLIQPGERYYWEGNATMIVPSTPAWSLEQHKAVE